MQNQTQNPQWSVSPCPSLPGNPLRKKVKMNELNRNPRYPKTTVPHRPLILLRRGRKLVMRMGFGRFFVLELSPDLPRCIGGQQGDGLFIPSNSLRSISFGCAAFPSRAKHLPQVRNRRRSATHSCAKRWPVPFVEVCVCVFLCQLFEKKYSSQMERRRRKNKREKGGKAASIYCRSPAAKIYRAKFAASMECLWSWRNLCPTGFAEQDGAGLHRFAGSKVLILVLAAKKSTTAK